jgi:hypothetical protein
VVKDLIVKNRIRNTSEVYLKGWMAYQFDPSKNRITSGPIEKVKIAKRNVIISTYLNVTPKPYPEEVSKVIRDENVGESVRETLMRIYSNKIFSDCIFVLQNPDIKVIVPKHDVDKIIEHVLNPTFGARFSMNFVSELQVPVDLLQWLTFKVKKRRDGALNEMIVTNLSDYGAFVRGRAGELDVKIKDVENDLFAQISVGIRNECRSILVTISFKEREYTFFLREGMGKFRPLWSSFRSQDSGNYRMDRIRDVITIALEIIPNIVREYRNDTNWPDERNDIFEEELSKAKEKIP